MRHTLLLLCCIHRITHSQPQPQPRSAPATEWVDATGTIEVYHCTPRADADMGSAAYSTLCPELWATLGGGRRGRAWAEDPQSERWTAHGIEAVEVPLHGHMNRDGDGNTPADMARLEGYLSLATWLEAEEDQRRSADASTASLLARET